LACAQSDIDHRLTKPKHPWTNGQVERMNRTIKDATVKRFYCKRCSDPTLPIVLATHHDAC
jgi:transposase InsO family protein